jgi:signal transduction histidine kinase
MRTSLPALTRRRTHPPLAFGILAAILAVAVETVLTRHLAQIAPVPVVITAYLPGIAVVASVWGLPLGLVTALTSTLTFVLPPAGTLRILTDADLAVPMILLIVAPLTCLFSALYQSPAVESRVRDEADLSAELVRLLLLRAVWERERSAQALRASRARIVAAADQTRRQIGRDLHDGAQQHLVSIQLELRNIEAVAPPELKPQLARTAHALDETFTELREISRGLHPPILAKGGIRPALAILARRCPIIVDLNVAPLGRLPEQMELAVYYVAAEALTNAAKHARASMVHIDLSSDSTTHLAVRDDGVGGAEPSRGSGLIGLADRVEALGGTLRILSPVGGGTELHAEFPA